jgi:uncharacterized membrane protein YidH (DUF202 family)
VASAERQPDPRDAEPEDADPGLVRARTSLAWTRTALSVAAVGGAILKSHPVPGAIVLVMSPVVWLLGRIPRRSVEGAPKPGRLLVITITIVAICGVALGLAFSITHGPGTR